MEKDGDFYHLSILITSSRRPSQLTNTFMKALSSIFDSPIVRRGSSSLDHISIIAKENDFKGFLIVFTRMGNPSVINLYALREGIYSLFTRLFILGTHINRRFRGPFEALQLILRGESSGAKFTYECLKEYFELVNDRKFDSVGKRNIARVIIDDLTYIDQKKYWKLSKDPKFNPSEINILGRGDELLLRIKLHHISPCK